MASIFGHFAAGYTSTKLIDPRAGKALIFLAMASSFLPDADVIGYKLDVAYESFWGHRGFTHSLVFAVLWGGVCSFFFKEKKLLVSGIIALATASHGLLDMMTTGGLGVAIFAPFDNTRYFLPWRPIKVSPLGIKKFFSEWGWNVLVSEFMYVGIPCIVLLAIRGMFSKNSKS